MSLNEPIMSAGSTDVFTAGSHRLSMSGSSIKAQNRMNPGTYGFAGGIQKSFMPRSGRVVMQATATEAPTVEGDTDIKPEEGF